jgi:hypothetical protein
MIPVGIPILMKNALLSEIISFTARNFDVEKAKEFLLEVIND